MAFATFQGELVTLDPASPLGATVIAMLGISICCQLVIIALIFKGHIVLPKSIIPWVSFVFVMAITAVAISLAICISDSPVDPFAQWLAYTLYMNVAMCTSLCELQLFKIFTIVTQDLSTRDVTRVQIVFFTTCTLALVGHYANAFSRGGEPEWLEFVC